MKNTIVKDIYKTFTIEAPTVDQKTTIEDVIKILLKDPKSRSIYIVDQHKKLLGILSTLIILKTTHILKGKKTILKDDVFNAIRIAKAKYVSDIMHPPIYVYEEDKILDVLEKMSTEDIQELPVVDKEKRVIGDLNCLEILKRVWEL